MIDKEKAKELKRLNDKKQKALNKGSVVYKDKKK